MISICTKNMFSVVIQQNYKNCEYWAFGLRSDGNFRCVTQVKRSAVFNTWPKGSSSIE